MDLHLKYELDASLLLEGQLRIRRVRYAITIAYALTLLICGAAILAVGGPWHALGWVLVVGGPLTWLVLVLQFRRIAVKQMAMVTGPVQTELNDTSIRQQLPTMNSDIQWQAVTSVLESKRLWLLMINPYQAIHVPKSALAMDADATLRAFLKDRGLLDS